MMTQDDVFDRFIKYYEQGLFTSNPTALLLDLPTKSELEKGIKTDILQSDYFLVFAVSSYSDIEVGATFDCLFRPQDIKNLVHTKAVLKYVSVNRKIETNFLPKGHSGICAFEFQKQPNLLARIPLFNTEKDPLIHDSLILTQQAVIDNLIDDNLSYFNNQQLWKDK
ncbi:hypothetical protein ACFSUS_28775 [Spirosoma soli]|uniref:Uncharacterized protein n=1 Tax=Spirosoma soli TaxID=1770529 RepID=A0ABW5MDA6_9BACT